MVPTSRITTVAGLCSLTDYSWPNFCNRRPVFLGKWITLDSSRDLWVTPVTVSLGEVQEDEFVTDRIEAETEGWGGGGLMKWSNRFGWMKLFISFQVVIMSSSATAACRSLGWMFATPWLVGNLHDLSPGVVWFTRRRRKRDVLRGESKIQESVGGRRGRST